MSKPLPKLKHECTIRKSCNNVYTHRPRVSKKRVKYLRQFQLVQLVFTMKCAFVSYIIAINIINFLQ